MKPLPSPPSSSSAAPDDLSKDILLLDFVANPNPNPNPNSPTPHLFQEIFDAAIDENPGSIINGEEEEEEEELEWLANKDAFPPLETSFDPALDLLLLRPSRARSSRRRRRRKILPTFEPVKAPEKKKCRHCEAEETPQWRLGPDGPKTLCNACGVRFNSGRLVPEYRPANSPTFLAGIHSNSHRRVMEIRGRKYGAGRRGRPVYERKAESY